MTKIEREMKKRERDAINAVNKSADDEKKAVKEEKREEQPA